MSSSLYERMGGEPVVRKLVERFYSIMFELNDVGRMQELHKKAHRRGRSDRGSHLVSGSPDCGHNCEAGCAGEPRSTADNVSHFDGKGVRGS